MAPVMPVSVVVPVLNEAGSVRTLVDSLLAQTMVPDEIVFADGGSTDGTRIILDELAGRHPKIRVVDGPGGRSENRNAAVRAASYGIIACTDAGCRPQPTWLEQLTAPFASGADWVAGFYRPEGPTTAATSAGVLMTMVREEVRPDEYLPSGASQAFRRAVWEAAGGFPENMIAAEDTVFGERARSAGYLPIFVPDAVVVWEPPSGMIAMARKAFVWGRADGRARVRAWTYKRILFVYGGSVLLLVAAPLATGLVAGRWAVIGALAVAAAPLVLVIVRRTRWKYRWVQGAAKYLYLPLGHLLQVGAQTLGFLVGTVETRTGRA